MATTRTTFPSDRRQTPILGTLLAATLLLSAPTVGAPGEAAIDSVEALAPEDGAVRGSRPIFALGCPTLDAAEARRLRFRIEMEPERDKGGPQRWDQRRQRSGWGPGDEGEVLFRPPRPVPDGDYLWQAAVWNGLEWRELGAARRLRVDTVSPAPVERLRMRYEADGTRVRLEWEPVTLDENGGPEYVTMYHVFRFELGPDQPMARPYEIGVVEGPRFVDETPPPERTIVFYRVAAEDQAGNITGQRR